ncbi:MAG: ComEC/Rec2 family competence protein [Lachnospiraceae bacterium]|nr:ComEC/Rec2 family competence protein [Lachnospiraceae bacterium]
MKRPFLWAAAGMSAGICLFLYDGNIFLIIPVLVILSLILFRTRKSLPVYLLIGLFLGLFTCVCYRLSGESLLVADGTDIALSGIVKETNEYGFVMRVERFDTGAGAYSVNPFYSLFVTVSTDKIPPEYSEIILEGTVELYSGPDNPGQFDASVYYPSIGSLYNIRATDVTMIKAPGLLRRSVLDLRNSVKERLTLLFPGDSSGLPSALLLGDKRQMGDERRGLYERFGLAHILTISGLHIGLLGNLLLAFFICFLNRKASDRMVLVVLLFYGLLCGFRISCIRAVFTFLISSFSKNIKRSFDRISANAFLLMVILF